MRWRVYYGDGSTFSSDDGGPYLAPTLNVQVIACECPDAANGFSLITKRDFYWWLPNVGRPEYMDEGWYGGDASGLFQYQITPGIPKYILFGTSIDTEYYSRIIQQAAQEGVS